MAMGLPLPIMEMPLRSYRQPVDDGHGEEDISALYQLKGQQD
jgi:3-hydroxyisobutyrate dehydrogenase-like beta-hydroxyacid dehydrogenase